MKHLVCPTCRSRIVIADGDLGKPIRRPGCEELCAVKAEGVDLVEVLPAETSVPLAHPVPAPPSRGWLLPVAAVGVLCLGCGLCVGAGGIAGGYLWNRAPEGPPNQAEAKPKPKDGAKPPEVEVPPGSDKPLAELPADPPPKLAAFVPASPPAKSAVPRPAVVFVGNPDVADTVVYRLDSPVLRTEDIYFTNGPSRKFGFFAPIGKGKQLAHRFYLFDADTRQMPSSELPFCRFFPSRPTPLPRAKELAHDVLV